MINISCERCTKSDVCYKKSYVEAIDYLSDIAQHFVITCPNACYVDNLIADEAYFDYLVQRWENESDRS